MNDIEIRDALKRVLERHGLQCDCHNDWVLPDAKLPAIRGSWQARDRSGRLDVQVLVEDGVLIEEAFAGLGTGRAGFDDALFNFMVNSLHVLLSAFWGESDPGQVLTERWRTKGAEYVAHIGNIGTRASQGIHPHIPTGLFPGLVNLIEAQNLQGDLHWIRLFFCDVAGEPTYEALLDNEHWQTGVEFLRGLPWQTTEGYYSARNFVVLRKVT